MAEESIEKISIKYTGPVSLNARTLLEISQTLHGKKQTGETLKGAPMRLNEFFNLLNFIETSVMSNKIFYDGTLPKHELENLATHVYHLERYSETKIRPIQAKNNAELLEFCKSAAEQSSELFKDINVSSLYKNGLDKPVRNIDAFKNAIFRKYNNHAERNDEAQRIISDIMTERETFNGSKCVAGILSASLEDSDLLGVVSDKFSSCENDINQQEYLVGSLINRFRINYINKISSQDEYEAAYLIDPSIESIQSQQVLLLWKYILRRIERKYDNEAYQKVQNLFKGKYSTFPLGLAALLNFESKTPHSLFSNTLKLKDKLFLNILAKNTPQERYIHQFDQREFALYQDEILGQTFYKLQNKKFKFCEFINNRIPEVIGTSTGIALAAFVEDINPYIEMTAGLASAVVLPELLSKGLEFILPNNKYNVFLNNMVKLEEFYRQSIEANEDLEHRLVQQIETIFGRKLILKES